MSWYGRVVVYTETSEEKAEKIKTFLHEWFNDVDVYSGEVVADETNDFCWSFVDELKEKIKKFQKKENIKTKFFISVYYFDEPTEEYVIAPEDD